MGPKVIEAVDILTTLIITGIQDYAILKNISETIQQAQAANSDLTIDEISAIRALRDEAIKSLDDDIAQKETK